MSLLGYNDFGKKESSILYIKGVRKNKLHDIYTFFKI